MSSNTDFVSAQRRLFNLYENGPNMSQDEMVRALDGLLGITQQMVRNRREEIRNLSAFEIPTTEIPRRFRAITPPGSPPARRTAYPPPLPSQRHYPPAELRPAATPRTFPNLFAASAADYLRAGDYVQARDAIERAEDNAREEAAEARYTGPVRPSALLREINEIRFAERAPLGQRRDWMSWQFYEPVYIKKRSIGQARFQANCKEACAICLDTHTNGDTVVTECKHCFGKECWKTWMCNPAGNQTCPTCRTDRPNVISYTMRRPRANAMVEPDDNISEITQEN